MGRLIGFAGYRKCLEPGGLLGPEAGDWRAHQLREREAGRLPPGKDGALQIWGKKGEAYQVAGIR